MKKLKHWFITTFFFRIDKDERNKIRDKVMENDHKVYKFLLPILIVIEGIMLTVSFVNHGPAPANVTEHIYRGLYAFLIVVCFAVL